MKFDFTDGEWEIDDNCIWKKNTAHLICYYKFEDIESTEEEANANARLISCAPEMLNMVIRYTKSLQEVDGNFKNNIAAIKAIEIIEKATGKKWEEINN